MAKGRCEKPEHTPNREELYRLIRSAKGLHKSKDFAAMCGLTAPYYSRISAPDSKILPGPDTLLRIAERSEGRVSAFEILAAAGYEPAGRVPEGDSARLQDSATIPLSAVTVPSDLRSEILSALSTLPFRWKEVTGDPEFVTIALKDAPIKRWYFFFLPDGNAPTEDLILRCYGKLATLSWKEPAKLSLVSKSSSSIPLPSRLPLYVSFIKLEGAGSEIYLPSYYERNEALLSYLSIKEASYF